MTNTTTTSFDVTKFGPNMAKLYATATKTFALLPKGRDNQRAAASLVKVGAIVTNNAADGTVQFALADVKATQPKVQRAPKTEKAPKEPRITSMSKAVLLAQTDKTMTRVLFVKRLQDELGLSAKGASTYASTVRKQLGIVS